MSGIKCIITRGLKFAARCDFCGKAAEHVWLLFENTDGKSHICNECVQEMTETMYCVAEGGEKAVRA